METWCCLGQAPHLDMAQTQGHRHPTHSHLIMKTSIKRIQPTEVNIWKDPCSIIGYLTWISNLGLLWIITESPIYIYKNVRIHVFTNTFFYSTWPNLEKKGRKALSFSPKLATSSQKVVTEEMWVNLGVGCVWAARPGLSGRRIEKLTHCAPGYLNVWHFPFLLYLNCNTPEVKVYFLSKYWFKLPIFNFLNHSCTLCTFPSFITHVQTALSICILVLLAAWTNFR